MNIISPAFSLQIYNPDTTSWVELVDYVMANSLKIDKAINARSICTFQIVDKDGVLDRIKIGAPIWIDDGAVTYFSGGVDDVEELPQNPAAFVTDERFFNVSCTDNSTILDRHYITATYENLSSGEIVRRILDSLPAGDGLLTGYVEEGPTLTKVVLPTMTVAAALNELAQESGMKWFVDATFNMHWFAKSSVHASWDLTLATQTNMLFEGLSIRRTLTQYRNCQEVRGKTKADEAFSWYPVLDSSGIPGSDTLVTEWDLGKPIADIEGVYIDDKADGIGIKWFVAPDNSAAAFTFTVGGRMLRLNAKYTTADGVELTAAKIAPKAGQYLRVYFKSQTEVRAVAYRTEKWCEERGVAVQDTLEEMALIKGGSGEYWNIEMADTFGTVEECSKRANALLEEFGVIPTTIRYRSCNWGDLEPGQWQYLSLGGFTNKPVVVRTMLLSEENGKMVAEIEAVGSEQPNYLQFWRMMADSRTPAAQARYAMRAAEIAVRTLVMNETLEVTDSISGSTYTPVKTWGTMELGAEGEFYA